MQQRVFSSFGANVTTWIGVKHRIVLAVRIEVQPIAAVSVLLCKAGDDRIVEACTQVILLRDWVKLLASELETVGDFFFTEICITPCIILITIENNAVFINDVSG